MKRSEINRIIDEGIVFLKNNNYYLPPFAFMSEKDWEAAGADYQEIRDCCLGWDVTDFGRDDYQKNGLLLFTIRGGSATKKEAYSKPYCEKLLIIGEGQTTPYHFHWSKTEDIINRGGGDLCISVYAADENEKLSRGDVTVSVDGKRKVLKAGEVLTLRCGESITMTPYIYHSFWAEPGKGPVLGGEVSMVNDDVNDNRFYDKIGRFPSIVEDEPKRFILCNEYPAL